MEGTRSDADVVDGDDVGVVQGGGGLGLLLEAAHEVGLVGERVGKEFQRHIALQSRIASPIDLAHAAAANQRDDLVGAHRRTGRKRHRVRRALYGWLPSSSPFRFAHDSCTLVGRLLRGRPGIAPEAPCRPARRRNSSMRRLPLALVLSAVALSPWTGARAAAPPAAGLGDARPPGARADAAQARHRRQPDDDDGASRRREQRAAGATTRTARASARRWSPPRAARAARTRSAPSCSRRWPCCAPRSCWRRTASTAPSSTSRARWTSASPSASTRRSRSGASRRFSATTCG